MAQLGNTKVFGDFNLTGGSTTVVLARNRASWNDGTVISNVVGLLAWKNYGTGHVIFDASNGTSPDGTAISDSSSANGWASTYPNLMGWNGTSTYGVKVDYADKVDGFHATQTVGVANSIPVRDANGYIMNTWFNSNRADEATGAASYIYDTGDGYMRKKSLANARLELAPTVYIAAAASTPTANRYGDIWFIP
jgi:hypothetical protein